MGADGGSIPTREDLVKIKKTERVDVHAQQRERWRYCPLSEDPLQSPLVVDELGNIFTKESIVRGLLDKSIQGTQFKYIRNLKDVFAANFKPNPLYTLAPKKGQTTVIDIGTSTPFVCPLSGLEVGNSHKFSLIRPCGCVLSERALKECPSANCVICDTPFNKEDLIALIPDEEEIKTLRQRMDERRKNAPKKENKKRKLEEIQDSTTTTSTSTTTTSTTSTTSTIASNTTSTTSTTPSSKSTVESIV